MIFSAWTHFRYAKKTEKSTLLRLTGSVESSEKATVGIAANGRPAARGVRLQDWPIGKRISLLEGRFPHIRPRSRPVRRPNGTCRLKCR